MNLYEIVGLKKTIVSGVSYETNSHFGILNDENGKPIRKDREFVDYILYAVCDSSYYAIHMSTYHCASFGGKLCHIGLMDIAPCDYTPNIQTHSPIQPLFVWANFEIKKYDYDEEMDVYLHDEPNTWMFQFSAIGGDERTPGGYVHVNMELFEPSDA